MAYFPVFEFELFLVIEKVMFKKLSEIVPEKKVKSISTFTIKFHYHCHEESEFVPANNQWARLVLSCKPS